MVEKRSGRSEVKVISRTEVMNILTVCLSAVCISFMATMAHGASIQGVTALVDEEQFQKNVNNSLSLIKKILCSIEDVRNVSISIKLNSPNDTSMSVVASNIGMPQAPVLPPISESSSVETSLIKISEGLQHFQKLLAEFQSNSQMQELSDDIQTLNLLIHDMLKPNNESAAPAPTQKPVELQLSGGYDTQVAIHLTLQQLEAFGRDVQHSLKIMGRNNEEDEDCG